MGVSLTSGATNPLAAGSYSFESSYLGDNNYGPSADCKAFTIGKATPTVSNPVYGGATTGATAYDTATIGNPVSGFVPTGDVTYTFYENDNCVGAPATTEVVALGTNSSATAPLAASTYSFQASYSGDGNYNPGPSPCTSFTVAKGIADGDEPSV